MPGRIDRRQEHRLEVCPACGGPLQRCRRTRTRTVEDIQADLRTEVTEHTVHRDYCPACRRDVEPVVPDALPNAGIGHRLVGLTGWLHYGVGVTTQQVLDLVGIHLQTRLTAGGLICAWHRLAEILTPWYDGIGNQARGSAVLNADETGWRVNGRTHWLWCFAGKDACYYLIDRSRGAPALGRFFTEAFEGVLVHDFWAAYDAIEADDHQCCLAHLLRELEKVDLVNDRPAWKAFAKRLRRLLRHCDSLFTFLDRPDVPYENNRAERLIRPAVILRKTSQSNRSDRGAATQAILMSVYRTLKLRGQDPVQTIAVALRTYTATGRLPPLPVQSVADG